MTHDVDVKVMGVNDRLKGVEGNVQDVRSDVHDVGSRLDQVNRSLSLTPAPHSKHLYLLAGNQLRDSLSRWLSSPDPSTNHNIACKAHCNGTARWFFQGTIFNQWKSTGSFLWIHGKRALLAPPSVNSRSSLNSVAGSGKTILWFAFSQLFQPL